MKEAAREIQPFHARSIYSANPALSFTHMNSDEPLKTSPYHEDGQRERLESDPHQAPRHRRGDQPSPAGRRRPRPHVRVGGDAVDGAPGLRSCDRPPADGSRMGRRRDSHRTRALSDSVRRQTRLRLTTGSPRRSAHTVSINASIVSASTCWRSKQRSTPASASPTRDSTAWSRSALAIDGRAWGCARDAEALAVAQVFACALDESDQQLTGALQVGVCFAAGQFHLFASDLGVGRDGCELSVNLGAEVEHHLTQLDDFSLKLGGFLIAEDLVFSQRTTSFTASLHAAAFHPGCPHARVA